MNDVALIEAAITKSGLSLARFARDLLIRDPRTVTNWLDQKHRVPAVVRRKLSELATRRPAPRRKRPRWRSRQDARLSG